MAALANAYGIVPKLLRSTVGSTGRSTVKWLVLVLQIRKPASELIWEAIRCQLRNQVEREEKRYRRWRWVIAGARFFFPLVGVVVVTDCGREGREGTASRERAAIAGTFSPVTGVTMGGKEKKNPSSGALHQ